MVHTHIGQSLHHQDFITTNPYSFIACSVPVQSQEGSSLLSKHCVCHHAGCISYHHIQTSTNLLQSRSHSPASSTVGDYLSKVSRNYTQRCRLKNIAAASTGLGFPAFLSGSVIHDTSLQQFLLKALKQERGRGYRKPCSRTFF